MTLREICGADFGFEHVVLELADSPLAGPLVDPDSRKFTSLLQPVRSTILLDSQHRWFAGNCELGISAVLWMIVSCMVAGTGLRCYRCMGCDQSGMDSWWSDKTLDDALGAWMLPTRCGPVRLDDGQGCRKSDAG
eukprot:COSAG02_NODE_18199_length_954_cov_0.847953_2_plen_135_part_00